MAAAGTVEQISPEVFLIRDTCNVYLIRAGRDAVAIDFGSGIALELLATLGIDRLRDVLVTHHHRDQVAGLHHALAAGADVWVPPVEQDLFRTANELWRARSFDNDYDVLQDRWGPLTSIPVTGVLPEYRTVCFAGVPITTVPTPGHTIGSVTFLAELDGLRLAFTGDLMAAGGKVWSLAATQWTYNGVEGAGATWRSAWAVADHHPDVVLPSHGEPIRQVRPCVELLTSRLQRLIAQHPVEPVDLDSWRANPYDELTPHLLQNRTSMSRSYVLLSRTGRAMLIDFGYDFSTGLAPPGARASRRPLLATIGALKSQYGIDRVDVAIPTHYHDDHVAGFNLLREAEGTRIWAAENFASVLAEPTRYDLPCLWYDPVPVDRVVPLGTPITWQEYELRMYDLPGHTLYACAIAFEADGVSVVASGDQQGTVPGFPGEFLNYTYRNRFRHRDFERSAQLYLELGPDLLISGHWEPRWVDDDYLAHLLERGRTLAELHEELLPFDTFDLGAEGKAAWLRPYRATVTPGASYQLDVEVRNPFAHGCEAQVKLVLPTSWSAQPARGSLALPPHGAGTLAFQVQTGDRLVERERIACDVTVGDVHLGLAAEALVTVTDRPSRPLPTAGADARQALS